MVNKYAIIATTLDKPDYWTGTYWANGKPELAALYPNEDVAHSVLTQVWKSHGINRFNIAVVAL